MISAKARREEGSSTVELGLLLPVLVFLLVVLAPLVRAGWHYMVATRAVSHGVRYASRAEANARYSSGILSRRPSTQQVSAFVTEAADPLVPTSVTVEPQPLRALPGERIVLTAQFPISFGPAAAGINAVRGIVSGGRANFPESITVTVSAAGREE